MLSQIMAHAEGMLGATTPEEASARFYQAASAAGASYMQTRLYRRPEGILTSPRHYARGRFVARMAPAGWPYRRVRLRLLRVQPAARGDQ
jgi:LuxR family quorum sensing-dependent transcriptional regulator